MGLLFGGYWLEGMLFLASLFYLINRWVQIRMKLFEERGIPYITPSYLQISTWKSLLGFTSMIEEQKTIYDQMKGYKIGGIFRVLLPFFVVRDPDLIQRVLIKDFSHFHDRGIKIDEETNPLEAHLFLLSGDRWRTLRVKLSPIFTSGKLKWMYGQMQACADILLSILDEKIEQGNDLDIRDILACFTTDVIGSCVFGYEPESMKNPQSMFRKMSEKIFHPSLYYFITGMLRFTFPELTNRLKLKTVPPEMHEFFTSIMKQTMDMRKKSGIKRNDFVQLLLQLKEKGSVETDPIRDFDDDHLEHVRDLHNHHGDEKIELTDELLTAQATVFIVAGFETSATSMSFTLYLLSKHHDIQEKARKEVRTFKNKHGGFTYQALKEMEYLEACFKEALRMYPPIPSIFRECTKNILFEEVNMTFQKGDRVIIPTVGIHNDPQNYPSPQLYRPERFLEGQGSIAGTFLPFGDGPRVCIGKRFAMVEAKLGLAVILDKYKLEKSDKTMEPLVLNPRVFVPQPKGGLWVKFSRAD